MRGQEYGLYYKSPSTRRAWIEISWMGHAHEAYKRVALHPEGVDRNQKFYKTTTEEQVALHPEGVDRNPDAR